MLSVRKPKTSDFFEVKFRCFASKVRRFASEKSDVFEFPKPLLQKKFCVFLLHFLHQSLKFPLYIGNFGCRIGCRIEAGCRMNTTFSALFTLFSPLLGPQHPAFPYDSVPNSAQNCSTIGRFLNGSSAKHSKWFCCIGGFYCGQIRLSMAGFSFPHPAAYHAKQGVKSAKTVLLV